MGIAPSGPWRFHCEVNQILAISVMPIGCSSEARILTKRHPRLNSPPRYQGHFLCPQLRQGRVEVLHDQSRRPANPRRCRDAIRVVARQGNRRASLSAGAREQNSICSVQRDLSPKTSRYHSTAASKCRTLAAIIIALVGFKALILSLSFRLRGEHSPQR